MLPSLQEHILQAGTVDLDGSYLAQLAIFIVFAVILNFLVVKPLGRLQELRYSRMAGARIDAEKMDLRAAEARNSYQGSMNDARTAAVSLRESARDAATASVRASVESVKDESSQTLQAGRAVLSESAEKSRDQLDQEIATLAALIADQLLDTKRNAA